MKSFFFTVVLIFILSVGLLPVRAQSIDGNIKAAKATAAGAVVRDNNKLPPDSMKWKRGGSATLNFSQTSFSNWSGGGENVIAFGSTLSLFANYKKNKAIWENNAFLALSRPSFAILISSFCIGLLTRLLLPYCSMVI